MRWFACVFMILAPFADAQLDGTLFRRISRVSNFEFAVLNNGRVWGDYSTWPVDVVAFWPRGSFHLNPWTPGAGFVFLAKKKGRPLVSDAGFLRYSRRPHGPFDQTVPGRIGDPRAGYEPVYNGAGWRYIDDPDYIVYSSLDYDSSGVDISGSNYNDWPIRLVEGKKTYVADPLERSQYPPVYLSDEDMFCVFKDTDTRADPLYTGPGGASEPIGIEVENYIYTWGSGPAKDIVLLQYVVLNKSGVLLDSCYIVFGTNLELGRTPGIPGQTIWRMIDVYKREPWRNLTYVVPTHPERWIYWLATPTPPTIGYPLLRTPEGYQANPVGLAHGLPLDMVSWYLDSAGSPQDLFLGAIDSVVYRAMVNPRWLSLYRSPESPDLDGPVVISGPFPLAAGDTARMTVGIIFAENLRHLLLLDEYIRRVYESGFKREIPPPVPRLMAMGLNRAVKLTWDSRAEEASDPIIPDSLGEPFRGYRLLRAEQNEGPYVEVGRWVKDSTLVHEYLDRGEDIGGLKNNVRYYYRLLSFDGGAEKLHLDPMESAVVERVNSQSVIPTTDAEDVTAVEGEGELVEGTLGDVSVPELLPRERTNYNGLFSGKEFTVELNAATDGVNYTLPVTIRDSLSGRVHNAIIDPRLLVHGSSEVAGRKEGRAVVEDLFGLGGADLTFDYRFEQLADSFHIEPPVIESAVGADVPILISDSLRYTGIKLITPYTTAEKEIIVEFTPGGVDTISLRFQRFFPYLNVEVRDAVTRTIYEPGRDWEMRVRGVVAGTTLVFEPTRNRYYLSGMISNGEELEFGHELRMYESVIVFDYTDRGRGSGKAPPLFPWGSSHRRGTKEFQSGDRVPIHWKGGVKAVFPRGAIVTIIGGSPGRREVTEEVLEGIRIVPNPFIVRDQQLRGQTKLYFNYLPEECVIRIYTLSLDLVKTIQHRGGSREEWDVRTEGGQLIASQMLIAHIEAANGVTTVKKFAVVVGE